MEVDDGDGVAAAAVGDGDGLAVTGQTDNLVMDSVIALRGHIMKLAAELGVCWR